MADNYIDVTLSEIFGTGVASVEQTQTSEEPGGLNVWTITLTNGYTSTFTVRNGTAGGTPMPVVNSADMTDTNGIYLYLGNEEGYTTGHWYCYANGMWTDFGAYSEKGEPGFAPTVETSKTGGTTTVTITDAVGEHVITIEDGISPTVNVANTAADMTDTSLLYVYAGSETGYTNGNWYFYNTTTNQWTSGGQYQSTVPRIDTSLTLSGVAADSKKVGDEISDLKSQITNLESIPSAVKSAMDNMFAHALFKDYDASGDYAVFHSWVSAVNLLSISAVFAQGANVIYDSDSLDDLKQYLTVTANYDNGTSTTLSDSAYTLSGAMEEGTQTFTVSYDGKSDSFTADISYDSTPKLLTSGYYRYHVANADNVSPSSYALQASTNAGVTIKYDFDPMPQVGETYQLCGIFPTGAYNSKDFYKASGKVASLLFFDAQGNHLAFLNELSTSTFNRWLQNGNSTMTEYGYQSVELTYEVGKIECQIDIRHLDDTYLYEGVTGHVFFAGRNTPYFGMHNISEAGE